MDLGALSCYLNLGLKHSDSKQAKKKKINPIQGHNTDQFRKGDEVVISKGQTNACPMSTVMRYMVCAGIDSKSDHFLFKPAYCYRGRRFLTMFRYITKLMI